MFPAVLREPREANLTKARAIAHPAAPSAAASAGPAAANGRVYTRQMSSASEGLEDVAYELVQGPLVRYCTVTSTGRQPPTAVLVHGILGNRRNLLSFANRMIEAFPSWQILLVDLRCHGESASTAAVPTGGPHGVASAAADLLKLLRRLKLFPDALIGHSFGGKVVLSMADQFGQVGRTLPKPVQVWVLDSLPGEVRAGGGVPDSAADVADHPARLIQTLRSAPQPVANKNQLVTYVAAQGFSQDIARWAATNLRPLDPSRPGENFVWSCDLEGISQMYEDYEETHLWHLITQPQQGLKIDFVKAERSTFRWGGQDEETIKAHGHRVHLLRNSGHWVHTDNPEGLLDILRPSLGQSAAV